jgi:hypothetical protein
MHVVHHHDERLRAGGVSQERCDRIEEPEPRLLGLERRRFGQSRDPLAHLGADLGDVGGAGPHNRHELLGRAVVDVRADDLHPRPVGGRALALVATTDEHLRSAQARVGRKLVRHARLADARLTDEQKQPASSG